MFESGVELPAMGAERLAGLIAHNHAELMERECRTLQLACAWADAHYLDSGSQDYQPVVQRPAPGAGKAPRRSQSIAPPNSAPYKAPASWRRGR